MFLKGAVCLLFITSLLLSGCSDETDKVSKHNMQPSQTSPPAAAKNLPPSRAATDQPLALLDISEREYGDINAIALLFNNPLKENQHFSALVQVKPALAEPVLSEDGRSLYFTGIEPAKEYSLEVQPGIKSSDGSQLDESHSKILKTRDLPSVVSFEVDGAVMVPGKVNALPVLAVNVSQADVEIYRVKPEKTVDFFSYYQRLKDGGWYYERNPIPATVDHVYSTRIKIGSGRNQRYRVNVALANLGGVKEPGVYFATVKQVGAFEYDASTWFSLSAIGLQARDYGTHSRFITQDAASGRILSSTRIQILDHNNQVIVSGETDANGAWQIESSWKEKSPRLIVARKDNQITVLDYAAPMFDLSGFDVSGRATQVIEHFIYAPRDIYRPGDELTLSVLKRNLDGQLLDGVIMLKLFKPDGEVFGEWRVDEMQRGYYAFTYVLPDNAPLGNWYAEVHSPEQEKVSQRFDFQVEEFLPERLRLIFNESDTHLPSFTQGEPLNIKVEGEYLYGAPAARNALDTRVSVNAWSEPFDHLKGYRFGHPDSIDWDSFELDKTELDTDGKSLTRLTEKHYRWSALSSPARVNVRYSLYESGGRAINRTQPALYWPLSTFVGVKPHFENDQSEKNAQVSFDLLRVNQQGQMQTEGEAKVSLYREEENYFWSYTPERGWHYQVDKNEYVVASNVVTFISMEPVNLQLPVEWGRYRLEIDDLSAKSKTIYRFHAGERWYADWQDSGKRVRPDRVNISLGKSAYRAGGMVKVKLASPTDGTAVVLLETDQVLYSTEIQLQDKTAQLEIPIPADLTRHDAYISAFVVAPTDDNDKVHKRSMGIAHLPLDRSRRQLDVDIQVPETWRPEKSVITTVNVTDAQGKPVTGEVYLSLSAVDTGVLNITGYETPDPFAYFYGRRGYGVNIYDMYNHLAEKTLYEDAEIRWGGDAELTRGGDAPPGDVQIVSLFRQPVAVINGVATVALDLPAFDGELTLTAVAMGADRFGYDKTHVKVASPIVAQLSTPRFMALGDKAHLTLDLSNLSGADQPLNLSLNITGAISGSALEQRFDMKEGKRSIIQFEVDAVQLGEGLISAEITLGEDVIQRQWHLGVRSAYPAQFGRESRLLREGDTFSFPMQSIDDLTQDSLKAQLRIARSPDLQQQANIEYLQAYPYRCLEQTTSTARVLLHSADNTRFKTAIARYSELQLANGGFGLWYKHSAEEHWLTAYAVETLLDLKAEGYAVPEVMIDKAQKRLEEYVYSFSPLAVETWSDIPSHYEVSYKAYAAYLLAGEGNISLGAIRDIVEKYLSSARGPLPGVHLGLALIESGSVKRGNDLIQLALSTSRKAGYLGDYGSPIRDQSMVLFTVLNTKGTSGETRTKALRLLPGLMDALRQQSWLSPQERSVLLRLATLLLDRTHGKTWQGALYQADIEELLQSEGVFVKNLDIDPLDVTRFINRSDLPVYASFSWRGLSSEKPKATNEGIQVQVTHYRLKNGNARPLEAGEMLEIGDLLLNRVRLVSDKNVPDALLVNLLPAGLELENQNLTHALKLENIKLEGRSVEHDASIQYQAFRDDRYVAAIELEAGHEDTLYFLTRAVTPGSYQVPPAMVESMYKPSVRGISDSIEPLRVKK